jgi:hypothetical protein
MKSGHRLALTVWLALATSTWLSTPSFAQKNRTATLTACPAVWAPFALTGEGAAR